MKRLLKNWYYKVDKYANNTLRCLAQGIVLLCPLFSFSQINLVQNPSFEIISNCPTYYNNIHTAVGWDTLIAGGGGTPDIFNKCAPAGDVGVPYNNTTSYQQTHSGLGYSDIFVYTNLPATVQREYIQSKLKQKLTAGKSYCVTFYVSLINTSMYAIDEIGAYFDDGSISSPPHGAAIANPQVRSADVVNEGGQYLSDTLNWITVNGSFTATGTEEYITLGNFKSDNQTNSTVVNSAGQKGAGYYFDDISVIEINTKADAGKDTVIAKGDSTFIGLHDIGDNYTWYANGTAFYIGSEAGLWVKPQQTTTYVCKQTVCSVVTYDTCVVSVKPSAVEDISSLEKLKLYPNPVTDGVLHIDNANANTNFEFYNLLGEKVLHAKAAENIDVSGLSQGIYFLKIQSGSEVITQKIVIQ